MTIATKRTLLVPYTEQFESFFLMLNCCAKNRAFLGGPLTVSDARVLFHELLESADIFTMAVFDNYNREYIGHIQLSIRQGIGDLLFIFDKSYWSKGFAYEALHSFVTNICHTLPLTEVKATTDAQNSAAVRLLKKLGFHLLSKDFQQYVFTCDVAEPKILSA